MGYQPSVGDCLKGKRQKILVGQDTRQLPPASTCTHAHRSYVYPHTCTHAHTHTAGKCTPPHVCTCTHALRSYVYPLTHMHTYTHTAGMCTHTHVPYTLSLHKIKMNLKEKITQQVRVPTHAHTHTTAMCTHSQTCMHTHTHTAGIFTHTHAHAPYTLSLHKIKMNLKEREKVIQTGTSALPH